MAVQSRGSHICMWRPLFGLRFRPCAAQGSCGLPGTYHAFRGGPLSRGVRTALELQGTYSTFCGRPRSRLPKAPQLVFLGYPRFFGGGGGGGGEGWGWGGGEKLLSVFHENVYPNKRIYSYHFGLFGGLSRFRAPGLGRFGEALPI